MCTVNSIFMIIARIINYMNYIGNKIFDFVANDIKMIFNWCLMS